MALVSPGVEVTVIDESQYIPSAVNTVPYFLIATAQNKADAAGVGVAAGTTAANANKTYLITSQRDLAATYGVPFFYNTTTGTPINGYELNEYGLLAAYSALGVTNRAYVQRVDIDLTELAASLSRPTGDPDNGTYWLDTSTSTWGIFQWNQGSNAFTLEEPLVITDTTEVVDYAGGDYTPLSSVGVIGEYAVSAVSLQNPMYYKNFENVWVFVGSDNWKLSWPTIQGSVSNPNLAGTFGYNMYINGNLVSVPAGQNVTAFSQSINTALPYASYGFFTAVVDGQLVFYADSTASNDNSTANGGIISIQAGPNNGTALLTALGISPIEYYAPSYFAGYSYQAPRWGSSQAQPAPTGSVWQNISAVNNGMSVKVKKYNATLDTWVSQTSNVYSSDAAAIYAIDPTGGGKNIPVGTTYTVFNALLTETTPSESSAFEIFERAALGATFVTGDIINPTFTSGDEFQLDATFANSNTFTSYTITVNGTTPAAFVSAVSAAAIPAVGATVNSAGAIVLTHIQGGTMMVTDLSGGTAIADAGFTTSTPFVRASNTTVGQLVLSNWVTSPQFTYTASNTAPDQNPADGRLWYYSSVSDVDIMIQENGAWVGYQNVTNDTRGFDLSVTNASGPIIAATAPITQNNTAESPLQLGDLWVDTSDLENYPLLYRWEQVNGTAQWVQVDTTDQVSSNGILFADARWAPSAAVNPVSDALPTIESLLTSDHLDLDAPNPDLYPQGMLLWNTRRSGYNVKAFTTNYFTSSNYPDAGAYNPAQPTNNANLPKYSYTWVTASGNKANGSMYAGRQAQRALIVQAMKSGIDTSLAAREEQNQFNLIAAPAYPELLTNLVALSNERANTLFCVGDTPMRLAGNGTDLTTYATDNNGLGLPTGDGLTVGSAYAAVFYPSCQTTDLSGNTVVAPPSHMMVRTILRSDAVSYPWLAPAGTRRGVVDNASAIGYIDSATGEFQQIAVSQGLRDVLYQNNINPITFIPGIGITNFGNKTRQGATTALDRINVARLICFLRGRLEEIGKLYLFEPNDQITRNEITNTVNSLMIDLIAKRAIYDYLVVCDLSNNTPARIDRNELWVDVAIEPVKAVEFIYIPLRIKNTGEISGLNA
jgi:phage tail sheath protein FI